MTRPARRAAWGVGAVLLFFAAFTIVKAVLSVADEEELGTPGTSALLPLPDGAAVVDDRTYEGGGSLGGGRRVLVVDTSAPDRPPGAFTEAYLGALVERGWRRPTGEGALSPDSRICLGAVTMADYLESGTRPDDTKRVLRDLDRPAGTTAVVSAIFC